jgi:hypothetical protein
VSFTHLLVAHLDPISIELMVPERTVVAVCHMILLAVNAVSRMGAGVTRWGGRDQGLSPWVPFTTSHKDTMVLLTVRTLTISTLDQGSMAC